MKKNWIMLLAGCLVGYVLGIVIGLPQLDSSMLGGDISKVSRYSQKSVDPAIKAIEEKLQNDSTYLQGTVASLIYINARMQEFSGIVELTQEATSQLRGTEATVAQLVELKAVSDHAQQLCTKAVKAVNEVIDGQDADFENAINRTTIAYMNLGSQIRAAKQFVNQADQMLANNDVPKEQQDYLILVRNLWTNYCTMEALINRDDTELDYWNTKAQLINPGQRVAFSGREQMPVRAVEVMAMQDAMIACQSNSMLQNNDFQAAAWFNVDKMACTAQFLQNADKMGIKEAALFNADRMMNAKMAEALGNLDQALGARGQCQISNMCLMAADRSSELGNAVSALQAMQVMSNVQQAMYNMQAMANQSAALANQSAALANQSAALSILGLY